MSLRIRVFVIVCMVLLLIYLLRLMTRKKINFKYGLGWILLDLVVILMAACPIFLAWLAKLTGVIAPINMLFFLGFLLLIGVNFFLSVSVSKLQDKVVKLSQEIAIMRKDARDEVQKLRKDAKEKIEELQDEAVERHTGEG